MRGGHVETSVVADGVADRSLDAVAGVEHRQRGADIDAYDRSLIGQPERAVAIAEGPIKQIVR
jgi:hypothetical protein